MKNNFLSLKEIAIGFNLDSLDNSTYPPHNIEQNSHLILITIAVASFDSSELSIELYRPYLIILGKKRPNNYQYIFKGIATRSFRKIFLLAEHVQIKQAILECGLLKIFLEEFIIENKPINIPINMASNLLIH